MLSNTLQLYNIILASGSPRRQQFLKDLHLNFEVRLKDTEEVYPPNLQEEAITNYLSLLKANAFENELDSNDLLITSDTIVWHNNKALGKPTSKDDAYAMLQSLSNTTHQVITSVCFKTIHKTEVIFDTTYVTFGILTNDMITYYLDNYKPYDKAGSYGVQEWLGYVAVSGIKGSYTNVMGLPTEKVYAYLRNL